MNQLNNNNSNNSNSNSNNISTNALPRIHIALRILPLASEDQPQNIIKISENEALLKTPSKSFVFEFDHIITEPPNYLYDSLPHTIINDLLAGQSSTLFINDSTQLQNRVDLKMISSLSYRLFTLKGSNATINVQYKELAENNTTCRDLLSHDAHHVSTDQSISKYEINQVQDIENYYKLGSEKQEPHCVSMFSLTLVQGAKIATFYIVNISGVDDQVTHHWLQKLNQKQQQDNHLSFIHSKDIYFVTAIHPNHETENTLLYASTRGRDPQHVKEEAMQRFEQWMIKLANSNESHHHQQHRGSATISSSSCSEYDRQVSMFSSVSNSTSVTVPESITEEKDHLILADLYRQIEELQNQVTVTRERNRHVERELQELRSLSSLDIRYHPRSDDMLSSNSTVDVRSNGDMERLLMVEEKQSLLIRGLESKLEQTEGLNKNLHKQLDLLEKERNILEESIGKQVKWITTEIASLSLQRDEIQCLSSVIDQRLDHQEYDNTQNREEIAQLRTRCQSQEKENVKKNRFIESVACQLLTSTTTTNESDASSVNTMNETRFEELNKCIKELVIQRNRYCEQLKESRNEYEKLQHALTMKCAKAGSMEKQSQHLAKELDALRQIVRDKDTSGMIRTLELKITTMELEKQHLEADFESSYESALNDVKSIQKRADAHFHTIQSLERTTLGLHEQLTHSSEALIQKDQEMGVLRENNHRLLKMNEQLKKQLFFDICHIESDKPNTAGMRRSRSSAPVRSSALSFLKSLGGERKSAASSTRYLENQSQLIKWYRQKTESPFGKIEIADRLLKMSEENHQLKVYANELETKVISLKQASTKEITSLENEVFMLRNERMGASIRTSSSSSNLVANVRTSSSSSNNLLQSLPRPPLRHDSGLYTNNNKKSNSERKTSIPPSPPSDFSRHNSYLTVRSTTSSLLLPPSDPPTNPLPPVPTSSSPFTPESLQDTYRMDSSEQFDSVTVRSYRNKIQILESDIRIHQQVITRLETQLLTSETKVQEQQYEIGQLVQESQAMDGTTMRLRTDIALITNELETERERKQTAEKQCQVLSKRLDDALINKRNKFRCF